MTVWRHEQNGEILSPSVDCEITVLLKDLNGQNVLESAFGISTANGGSHLLLNKSILGYNAFPGAGHTADSIRNFLAQVSGISKDRISVLMLLDPIAEAERNKVTQPQEGRVSKGK